MAGWVNVFERAVLDMKAERLKVELKNMGWHVFEKSSLTLERQERVLGAAEGEYDFSAIRGALIKLFPDTIISQEKRSTPDRKPIDRRPNDRFRNRFRKPRVRKTGRYTAHETDAHDAEEDANSEEEESCEEESDLTAAFEREMDELASVVEELEDTLDVQDVEDLRELSESMYEGLATIKETHAKLRDKTRNRGYQHSSSASSHADFGSRHASLSGTSRGKSKMRPKGGSVQKKKKLVTRCFDCNRYGHWSGDPICPAKDKHDAQAHMTSCTWEETVRVHPESFVTSSIAVEQEFRGAGACETCCDRTVVGQEWMNFYVHSLKKLKLKFWSLPCQERFKFGADDPVVCKTAYFIPVLRHGACAIMRVFVVPGKLMLLIGKDTLKVLEARFDLKSNSGIFPGAGDLLGKVLRESRAGHLMVPLLPDSSREFHDSLVPSETAGPLIFLTSVTNEAFSVKCLQGSRIIRDLMIWSRKGSFQRLHRTSRRLRQKKPLKMNKTLKWKKNR